MDVAGLDVNLGAECLERLQMQIDWTRTDRTASRHRHARRAKAGEQGRQHEDAGAHPAHHVVGRLRVAGCAGVEHEHPAGIACCSHAKLAQQGEHGVDIGHVGNIRQLQPLGTQQRGRNLRQGRVLRATDLHRAFNASAAANDQPVHAASLWVRNGQMGAPRSTHYRRLSLLYYGRHGHGRALRCPVYSASVNLDWISCTNDPIQRGQI